MHASEYSGCDHGHDVTAPLDKNAKRLSKVHLTLILSEPANADQVRE